MYIKETTSYRLCVIGRIMNATNKSPHSVYTEDSFQEALANSGQEAVGEFGAGMGDAVNSQFVTHTIKNIRVDQEGNVIGDVKFMHTPMGKTAQQMIKSDRGYGFAPRFRCKIDMQKYKVSADACMNLIIKDIQEIVSFDVVAKPAVNPNLQIPHMMPKFDRARVAPSSIE